MKQFILILMFCNMYLAHAQKNTLVIIADDVSPDYFGCFSSTTDTANTPNIRALAARGVKFTKVWSAPVCSPARAAMLTGRYPFRTGVGGVITTTASPQLDTAEISIAKLLKYHSPVAYNTACVGKWHLTANVAAKRLNPNKLGFDLYSGNFNGSIPNYYKYARIKNGAVDTVTVYATTQTVNDAINWMDTMTANRPFFLWLAFNAPHDPYHLPPATLCNTTGLSGTTANISAFPEKYFKAALEAMDTEIGRLFTYLTVHNLADSTNIIFMGDNGNQQQVAQIASTTKSKGTIYDYGVRVPMIAAGPSVLNGNRTSNELITGTDLLATIAELNGLTNWKSAVPASKQMDSRSFLPVLKNQSTGNRSWLFSETFNTPTTSDDGKTIRNQDYHLLRFDNGKEEFYNQTLDAEETNDLLLNKSAMTTADISNYRFLCDSMATLTGVSGCLTIGLNENEHIDNTRFYPNPTTGILMLQTDEELNNSDLKITIATIYGQQLGAYKPAIGGESIDISALADGMYFVTINYAGTVKRQTIIKRP